jgi:hypothetical protein
MTKTYRVNTSEEALELALKFKKDKKYDLFRGQTEDWPLIPSIYRLSANKREEVANRLFVFKLFLSVYGLEKIYNDSLDYLIAIAQHYGIPTDFIDFTYSPKVAIFFATHSNKNLNGKEGVILCLNKNDFKSVIKFVDILFKGKDLMPPYIFEPKINNLWRLKAQQGCFMQCAFKGIENLGKIDKIVFSHNNKCSSDICETDIYPENKSDLEIILDNYFAAERIDEGAKRLELFSKEIGIKMSKFPEQKVYQYVRSRKFHNSWLSINTKIWKYKVSNPYSNSKDIQLVINIQSIGNYNENIDHIEKLITSAFKEGQVTKKSSIAPFINFNPRIRCKKISVLVNRNVKHIWDGMRTLPYTQKQILYSISKYLALEFYDSVKKVNIEKLFHSPILIAMSDSFGTHCKCFVSGQLLQSTFREDILDIQSDFLPKSISTNLLFYVQKVKVIFDFYELLHLFHYEIIPSQMVRSKNYKNPTLFFSPAYIDRLGYA